MIRFLRSFWRREDGYATAEVVLLFPAILWPFMLAMESGLIQIRQAMVERGMDIVVRELRLGNPNLTDAESLKNALCDEILVVPKCHQDMKLEMGTVQVSKFAYEPGTFRCTDRRETPKPVTSFNQGKINEMMVLRFCVLHDPIFPAVGLGKLLPKEPGGGFPLIASTFFVNEPR